MSTTTTLDMEAGEKLSTQTTVSTDRPSLVRWVVQPVLCVLAVVLSLVYVNTADITDTERRSLAIDIILARLREHMSLSLVATLITVVVAVPLGIALTRGPLRRFARPITVVAGFGQAAPAIGLIALAAASPLGLGYWGAVVALVVYGALPIVANTVAGLDGVDERLIEASRGMGMSGFATLVKVELPLALAVIVAGIRTALVLIVGTATLAAFTGAGGLGDFITTGIKLQQNVTLVVGAILVASLALFIDWLARLAEMVAAPKGLS
ncbi:ABC transporter permease [Solicola sp. PLA-1-18]|uniref:ABC transporter permease n=1 Tax=Solicola sp. PLA-1-18 TaxID=3380532 RepID=UPI003B7EFB3F